MRSGKSDMAHGSNLTKVVDDFSFSSSTKQNQKEIVNSLALIKCRWLCAGWADREEGRERCFDSKQIDVK